MSSLLNAFCLAVVALGRDRRARAVALAALAAPLVLLVSLASGLAPALDRAERIPVAVVNLDQGVTDARGRAISSGDELVDSIVDSGDLAWGVVGEQEAISGLKSGTYVLILRIPQDYSKDVASLSSADPHRASVEIVSDGDENVLATRMGTAVLRQVHTRLSSQVGEDYLVQVLADVRGQASKLTLSSDGAVVMSGALDKLKQGTSALGQEIEQAAGGAGALAGGLDEISTGSSALGVGSAGVAHGMRAVADGAAPLPHGTAALDAGLDAASSAAVGLGGRLVDVGGALSGLSDRLETSSGDLVALTKLAPALAPQTRSLADALAASAAASQRIEGAAGEIWRAATAAQGDTTGLADDAGGLASSLSQEGSAQGMVQDLAAMQLSLGFWGDQNHRGALAGAYAVPADQRTSDQTKLIKKFNDDMSELPVKGKVLEHRLGAAADAAGGMTSRARRASDELSAAGTARDALADATDDLGDARRNAAIALKQVDETINASVGPAASVLENVAFAQKMLGGVGEPGDQGYNPGLAQATTKMGDGVRQIGAKLGPSGPIGAGSAGIARAAAALSPALERLSGAASQIASGGYALASALAAVRPGAAALAPGLHALAQTEDQAVLGVDQLKTGSDKVARALDDAARKLSDLTRDQDERAAAAARPLALSSERLDAVDSSVSSVVPVGAAAALWTGALLCALVLPACDRRRVLVGQAPLGLLSGLFGLVVMSIAQAALMGVSLALLPGFAVRDPVALGALIGLAALCFAALSWFARIAFRRLAAPVSLAVLLIQLVWAAAILPAALSVGVAGPLSQMLPVPVVVSALRRAIAGTGGIAPSAAVLLAWTAAAVAAALATEAIGRRAGCVLAPAAGEARDL